MSASSPTTASPPQRPSDATLVVRRLVGGTVGGVLQAASSHPFDTIKSRVQSGLYPTISSCVRGTIAKEGIKGFYRGVTPPLFLSGLNNSVLFSINQFMTNLVTPASHDRGLPLPLWRTAIAAQLTAPLYVCVITPMEVVKVKLQTQRGAAADVKQYHGPIDCIVKLLRNDGPSALLRGYLPTVGSRLVGLPFYFGAYQVTKDALAPPSSSPTGTQAKLPMYVPMISGVMAGLFFWGSNYPLDFIKTQLQASSTPLSFTEAIRRTYSAGGIRAFYKGFSACMVRSIPANSTVWLGIEYTTQFMISHGY